MGCSASVGIEDEMKRKKKNKEFEIELERNAKTDAMKFKLLLLGAGESGKSTIFKQIKVIYGEHFNDEDAKKYISTIHINMIQGMKSLTEQIKLHELTDQVECKDALAKFLAFNGKELNDDIADTIRNLWSDSVIQQQWDRRAEFQLIESVQRYFNRIDIIMRPSYIPDFNDMLHSRMRTSGICCESYSIDGVTFELYDVGGQRNERKKWIHCFEGVNTILFVAALSEYDQNLFEDSSVNRMVESLNIFEEICNNSYFINTSMILFLNKRDLFEKKIKVKHIKDISHFSDFKGELGDYDASVDYFVKKFIAKNKVGTYRQIYYHVTCATETSNIKSVFDSCKDIILRENLISLGFIQ